MYPMLLKAPVKDYLWGGTRLIHEFGFETDKTVAAEAWLLACHKDGTSVVCNGIHAGEPLDRVLAQWGDAALGACAKKFTYFPLLIKLIDARDQLSVQVHPDDAYALQKEGQYGKTEMWYVVDCEPDAKLIYGFRESISKEEFRTRIADNTLMEVANVVPVHKGDVFFIPAGTMHAIGAGMLIAEVQQNSNVTYRISDFGRLGADGKPRMLHIEQALEVTDTDRSEAQYGAIGECTDIPGGTIRTLASCEFFTASWLSLKGKTTIGKADSFVSVVCVDGEATLAADGCEELHLHKGMSIFLPAGLCAELSGKAELLCSSV